MSEVASHTIGKVVKRLQVSHPSLTVSKVRFLESEGLVSPQRTKSGYRMYTESDIKKLDAILSMQENYFYPLQIIKEKLEAAEKGAPLPEVGTDSLSASGAMPTGPQTLDSVTSQTLVPLAFIRSLDAAGIVSISSDSAGRETVGSQDVAIITAAFELKKFGIDPRLLRPYVQQTNRELPIFRQILAPVIGRQGSLDDERVRETFDETLENLIHLTSKVREGLLMREVYKEFNHPDQIR